MTGTASLRAKRARETVIAESTKGREQVTMLEDVQRHLQALADTQRARASQRFFKTGPGEYGEGDLFLGIRVPELRKLARTYQQLAIDDTETLLHSPFHEARLLALLIWVRRYQKGDARERRDIYQCYLGNTDYINNWDLVDASAAYIVGAELREKSKAPIYKLAKSRGLWERRIAVMATFADIKAGEFAETLKIAEILLRDDEDLIHKAVGWMLREVGNRDLETEEAFLRKHYRKMPRTMLRYAIERFPEGKRRRYLKGEID